jgi:predicted transcriptional regulator
MAATPTEIQSRAVDLATEAFEGFCEDISGMFGVDMGCVSQDLEYGSIMDLKKRFRKLLAVNIVKSEGILNGTFQLIFDQGGLFTLSGTIVMLPENRILEEIKRGTIKDVESMNDAVKEAGNLLVGSWDRIFRGGLEGHDHFSQTDTFIGTPWNDTKGTIGLTSDEEIIFAPYEMTIGSYPVFECGVIFPKAIFDTTTASDNKESEPEVKGQEGAEPDGKENSTGEGSDTDSDAKSKKENSIKESRVDKNDDVNTETAATTQTSESKKQSVSETIRRMSQCPAELPGRLTDTSSSIYAKDIMEENVVWSSPDDSVQQTLARMQQADVGYVMVGAGGVLEGIVSRSNIAEAISPYLRPVFEKWRRPLDDASLKIKAKWIMSRPVRTITPNTSFAVIIENMCRFGGRCLPVVNQDGKVQGLVTVYNILTFLLNNNPDITIVGKTLQVPQLIQLDS